MSYIVKVIPAPAGTSSTNVVYIPALGGTVVDTNSTQTLTNKTLTNAVMSSTNATLTTPAISGGTINGTVSITATNAVLTTPTLTNATITNPTFLMVVTTKAATGGNIATANALSVALPHFVLVTAANGTAGVQLPLGSAGGVITVKNSESAAAALKVYPQVNCQINEAGSNASITMAANTCAEYIAYNTTAWYSLSKVPS